MKKLSMLVAAVFAFVSLGALAAPKAAESANAPVATADAPAPQAKAAHAKAGKKKAGKKKAKKAM